MKSVGTLCFVAYLFWMALFFPPFASQVNFWLVMSLATGILAPTALFLQRHDRARLFAFSGHHPVIGLVAATALYLFFFSGNMMVRRILPFGGQEIQAIYRIREGTSPVVIGMLLLLWIGPAEEIFWRGFVQDRLSRRWGNRGGYLWTALIYAAGHLWAMNLTLFLAALTCGLFWGYLFQRYRSLWPGLISHGLWDVAIFVLFPMR